MPRNDKTGPNGEGSRSGRGLGLCGKNKTENTDTNFGKRNGQGCKNGRRRGNKQRNRCD